MRRSMSTAKVMAWVTVGVFVAGLLAAGAFGGGCAGRPQIIPHQDKSLRKTSAEFAADAAKRTYPADAPRGGEGVGRAQVGVTLNLVEVANLSDQDWHDVEVWVNKEYVVFVPRIHGSKNGEPAPVTRLPFQMLFNRDGQSFPTDNRKTLVNTVEVFHGGKVYNLQVREAD